MGASQIDMYGNQNFAAIGDPKKPKAQLLGMRGAPGNTINHTTSYWVPGHTKRSFVAKFDVVSGVGYDRAAALGPRASRFHEIRRVVSNLGVFDFATSDHRMRLAGELGGDHVHQDRAERGADQGDPDEVGQDQDERADRPAGEHRQDRCAFRRRADDRRGDQGAGDEAVNPEDDAEQPLADEARQQSATEQEDGSRQLVGSGEHVGIIGSAPPGRLVDSVVRLLRKT